MAQGDKPYLRKSTDRKAQIRKAFVQFSGLICALRSVDFLRYSPFHGTFNTEFLSCCHNMWLTAQSDTWKLRGRVCGRRSVALSRFTAPTQPVSWWGSRWSCTGCSHAFRVDERLRLRALLNTEQRCVQGCWKVHETGCKVYHPEPPHAQSLFLFPIVFGINNYMHTIVHGYMHSTKKKKKKERKRRRDRLSFVGRSLAFLQKLLEDCFFY